MKLCQSSSEVVSKLDRIVSKFERSCVEVRVKLSRSWSEVVSKLERSCVEVRAKLFCEVRFEVETISVPTVSNY